MAADQDVGLEAMQQLSGMVGEWKGEGWIRRGPGEPEKMTSTERVHYELDGRILVVRGLHFDEAEESRIVHNAYAVISWDAEAENYQFRTYLADGRQGNYTMTVENGVIKWFMDTPRGKITYSITIKDGVWKETGEMTGPDDRTFQFLEMELDQQK